METLQRTANRGSISTGYDIDNSLKFEADNSEGMWFAPSSTTNDTTWTFSCWFKQTELPSVVNSIFGHYTDANNQALYRIDSDNKLELRLVNGGTIRELHTDMVFRDTAAWYHLVISVDTTDGTSTNRVKVYVNGSQADLTGTYPTSSLATYGINTNAKNMDIGIFNSGSGTPYSFNGYLAEIHHIDGQQLAASDFGEFDTDTGIWKPKAYTGSYGTNGFYLDFEDSASLGADDSGNTNNFTLNNITSADQATDTPTNNFATYNALVNTNATYGTTGSFVIKNGATSFDNGDANIFSSNISTMGVKNGKWYAEFSGAFSNNSFVGIAVQENSHYYANSYFGYRTDAEQPGIGYYSSNGNIYKNGTNSAYGNNFTTNDIISIAVDMDNQYVYFAKNGTWQNSGDPTSGSSGTGGIALTTNVRGTAEFYGIGASVYSNDGAVTCNFGGFPGFTISSGNADANGYGNFEYAPPSGYYALCTKNLAEFG